MFGDHSTARAGSTLGVRSGAILIHGKDLDPVRALPPGQRPIERNSRLRPVRCDYITNSSFSYNIELTTESACATYSPILAHLRGRLRRRAEGGAGSGVLRPRLVTA